MIRIIPLLIFLFVLPVLSAQEKPNIVFILADDMSFDYYFGVDVPNFPPYLWIENNKLQGVPNRDYI